MKSFFEFFFFNFFVQEQSVHVDSAAASMRRSTEASQRASYSIFVKGDPDPEVDSRVILQSRVSAALPWSVSIAPDYLEGPYPCPPFEAEQRICSNRNPRIRRISHSTRLLNTFPTDSAHCLFTV